MNSFVQSRARRKKADFGDAVALQRASAAAVHIVDRFACQQANFERANDFLSISRRNAGCRLPIEAGEQAMKVLRATNLNAFTQSCTQFFGSRWRIGKAFQQRAQIEAGACGQDRQLAAVPEIFEHGQCVPPVIAGGENLRWLDEIDQMVRNSVLLGGRNFRRADVEVTVDLR